jgi:hypothetical protein
MFECQYETDDEFEQCLLLLEEYTFNDLTTNSSCTKKSLIAGVVQQEIRNQRLQRQWQVCEDERARLQSGIQFTKQMMIQHGAKPKQLINALKDYFDNPELAELFVLKDSAHARENRQIKENMRANNPKEILKMGQRERIHQKYLEKRKEINARNQTQNWFVQNIWRWLDETPVSGHGESTLNNLCKTWEQEEKLKEK